MDNLTHSLAGWAIGQAGLKRKSRKGLAALILGANAPDIDVFFGHAPWEPLAMHRGLTHSLIGGVIILPLLLTGLLLLLDRWQVGRGARFRSGLAMRPGWLLALAYIGTITHPLLDMLTTYSVQLLSPISGGWWHADALFIIDAFLWITLPLGIELSRWREKAGRADWARPAQVAVAAALAYIAFNLGLTERAKADLHARADTPTGSGIFASPPPVFFWRRDLVWKEGAGYAHATWDPLAGGLSAPPYEWRPSGLSDPLVRRALLSPDMKSFRGWSVMPLGMVETTGCTATVTLGDARYAFLMRNGPLSRKVRFPVEGCTEPAPPPAG